MILSITLVLLASLLTGAHFLRAGNLAVMIGCGLLPGLFFIKTRWSLHLLQAAMYLSAVIWLQTAVQLVLVRRLLGMPWGRAVAILGTVTVINIAAGVLLNRHVVQQHYPPASPRKEHRS